MNCLVLLVVYLALLRLPVSMVRAIEQGEIGPVYHAKWTQALVIQIASDFAICRKRLTA